MADSSNSFTWVTEGELTPRQEVHLPSMQIDDVFFTAGARHATKGLLCKHGIIIMVIETSTSKALNVELVQVLKLLLKGL